MVVLVMRRYAICNHDLIIDEFGKFGWAFLLQEFLRGSTDPGSRQQPKKF